MENQDEQPTSQPASKTRMIVVILIVLLALLYIAQKMGIGPVQTEEKLEWIDR